MLSGGLNADNIGEALRAGQPAGIDVSSGVESAPGVKDPALIADILPRRAGAAREERGLSASRDVTFCPANG